MSIQVLVVTLMYDMGKSKVRRETFEKKASEAGLPFRFFPAVDGKEVDRGKYIEQGLLSEKVTLRPGQIGCALSHCNVWRHVRDGPYDCALVLEDDAVLKMGTKDSLLRTMRDAPPEFDMLFVGHCAEGKGKHLAGDVYASQYPRCTHAYMVTRRGARKLCEVVDGKPRWDLPVDEELARLISSGKIEAFSVFPTLIDAEGDESIINA